MRKSFQPIEGILVFPAILTRPEKGELFYLYIAAPEEAVGIVLIVKRNSEQKSMYYTSKVLHGAEEWYQRIEKLAYAVVLASRRLKHYFKVHPVVVRIDQPIRQILQKPDLAGRLVSWSIELLEYGITFEFRKAIKTQVLVDFVTELIRKESEPTNNASPDESKPNWVLYTDESANQTGGGARIILEGPEGVTVEHSLCFDF